ncbi:hypothetical protein DXV76_08485 [Rhodobacteraceae bacterium CCMM004]|nr:hypothetical protein DXV76_08485 [Rhodobacteraceae bacterium CCMM004]
MPGPVAVILAEDEVELDTTLRHHALAGFRTLILVGDPSLRLADAVAAGTHRIDLPLDRPGRAIDAVNAVIAAAPGTWLYYCYNAEYLFYPFSESRSVGEMLTFHAEERRDAMLTYVIDLYATDLAAYPDAVSLETAHLDRAGYYAATPRERGGERRLDFFGGLRWRFEEHLPPARRRIDRYALFRAKPGLTLTADHLFDDPEYNTYACPWHHNLTAAICSFRTAKALRRNPGSRYDIQSFAWHASTPFEWHSQQLLDLGLMEPGQWF